MFIVALLFWAILLLTITTHCFSEIDWLESHSFGIEKDVTPGTRQRHVCSGPHYCTHFQAEANGRSFGLFGNSISGLITRAPPACKRIRLKGWHPVLCLCQLPRLDIPMMARRPCDDLPVPRYFTDLEPDERRRIVPCARHSMF